MSLIVSTEEACATDSQHASSFFAFPIELRRAVYAELFDLAGQHIQYIVGGDGVHRFRLTPCTAPTRSDEEERDGSERNPEKTLPFASGPIYQRRLLSSWGPHWMCEELAFHLQDGEGSTQAADEIGSASSGRGFYSALRVCKRMYLELVEVVTTATDFHVTDLRTLKALLDHREPAPFSFEGSICPRIARLSVTMSLPLAFFQAIEAASLASQAQDRALSSHPEDDDVGTWSHLPSRLLIQLPQLRHLHVWLDHNGRDYWSVVHERAILAPMEALKTSNPGLELVCVLPKVHPRIEDRQRHYLPGGEEEESSSSRLEIHRVLRQRYRVLYSANTGDMRVTWMQDFPHIVGNPVFDDMSLAEKEEFEGRMWRAGLDVQAQFAGRWYIGLG